MNAHQRRKQRRLYERAFGTHVDYYLTVEIAQQPAALATTAPRASTVTVVESKGSAQACADNFLNSMKSMASGFFD